MAFQAALAGIGQDLARPILIAGPTASGKSALALALAQRDGRAVVNADALQVYGNWSVLTARPPDADLTVADHLLYGHIAPQDTYSVGHWLREVAPLLTQRPAPILVGGTGLYFTALTEGLVDIPAIPEEIRAQADQLRVADLDRMRADLDAATRARIDLANPMRVQRAWEVLTTTGRGLAAWQDETPAPLQPLVRAEAVVLRPDAAWLGARIAMRFDQMLRDGALDEARANLPLWDPTLPAMRAIGAPELIGVLQGTRTLDQAREAAIIATRQYAKRQRTWFRNRMGHWPGLDPEKA